MSRRLAERLNAQSGVFVPLVTGERVVGVLVAATTHEKRVFGTEELALMEALAAEAALALDRTRSADALEQALERERLVAELSRRVRSERDVRAVLEATVSEIGQVLDAARCFIRLSGEDGEPLAAEWHAQGVAPLAAEVTPRLPAANLALQEGSTIAVADVATDPRLDDGALGGREALARIGVQAVLATPIVVFGRLVGVLALHRERPRRWTDGEISLAESVAGETGVAIRSARLLEENERRLEQQTALLKAAQVVTSELHLETVLERLVTQVAELLGADAADCYLLDRERGVLRCAAVFGMPPELDRVRVPGRPRAHRARDQARRARRAPTTTLDLHGEIPHEAYAGFAGAVVAPMTWAGEVRGVLGAGSREAGKLGAGRRGAARRVREPGRARAPQRRELRAEHAPGADPARLLPDRVGARPAALGRRDLRRGRPGRRRGARRCRRGRRRRAAGGLALTAAHELPSPLAEALASGLGAGDEALLQAAEGRRVLAARRLEGDERFDSRWLSPAIAAGYRSLLAVPVEAAARRGRPRARALRRGAPLHRRRPRARPPARPRRPRRARAERAVRGGALLARARAAARAHGQPARDRARPGGRPRRGRGARRRRCSAPTPPRSACSRATSSSSRPRRAWAPTLAARRACAGHHLARGRRRPVAAPVAVADVSGERRLLASDPLLSPATAPTWACRSSARRAASTASSRSTRATAAAWREEEIEALVALASNASAALSNAELYQRVAVEKERSVAIIANIADGIVAVDRDGNVVLWNEAAERITGVPTEEALGRRPRRCCARAELGRRRDNRLGRDPPRRARRSGSR